METLKIGKNELDNLIKEEIIKQDKKLLIKKKIAEVESQLNELVNAPVMQPQPSVNGASAGVKAEKTESIFDAKPGETVIFNFQDVTIKLTRKMDDLFRVTDAMESQHLKDGDYVQIQGNDMLQQGKKFKFTILRPAVKYETNPLMSWKVIKNR